MTKEQIHELIFNKDLSREGYIFDDVSLRDLRVNNLWVEVSKHQIINEISVSNWISRNSYNYSVREIMKHILNDRSCIRRKIL